MKNRRPSGRDAGSWLPVSLPMISICLVAVVSMGCILQAYLPGTTPAWTETAIIATIIPPTQSPQWRICTGVDGGKVNVRTCAGTGCAVAGILDEGQPVSLAGLDEIAAGSGRWAMITEPAPGWVNAGYLCESEER